MAATVKAALSVQDASARSVLKTLSARGLLSSCRCAVGTARLHSSSSAVCRTSWHPLRATGISILWQ
eukprot:12584116-Alexandrium_andersonii.AAC.1